MISAGGLVVNEEFFSTVPGFNVALYISSTPVCCCQLGLILINFGTCKIIHRQKRTSCSKSVAGLLPGSHQVAGLLPGSHQVASLLPSSQQICCKLSTGLMQVDSQDFLSTSLFQKFAASLQKSNCIQSDFHRLDRSGTILTCTKSLASYLQFQLGTYRENTKFVRVTSEVRSLFAKLVVN